MATATHAGSRPSETALAQMHQSYCRGSLEHRMAPHAVYVEPGCPHPGCSQRLQGIDFRVEDYGPEVHDALLLAWWTDQGIAGRCPGCGRWVHFRVREKRAISEQEATHLAQLPNAWADHAFLI